MALTATAFAQTAPVPKPIFRAGTLATLNHLRVIALNCRSKARADLFQACAVLSQDRHTARDTHGEVLMRCLSQALERRPVLFRPGAAELSFDEAWIARLVEAARDGDDDSFLFLICARVPIVARRNLAFLLRGVAEAFPKV